jgi:hypothetical protein
MKSKSRSPAARHIGVDRLLHGLVAVVSMQKGGIL